MTDARPSLEGARVTSTHTLAASAMAVFMLIACSSGGQTSPTSSTQTQPTPTTPTPAMTQTHASSLLRYQINYPAGWTLFSEATKPWVFGGQGDEFGDRTVDDLSGRLAPDRASRLDERQWRTRLLNKGLPAYPRVEPLSSQLLSCSARAASPTGTVRRQRVLLPSPSPRLRAKSLPTRHLRLRYSSTSRPSRATTPGRSS